MPSPRRQPVKSNSQQEMQLLVKVLRNPDVKSMIFVSLPSRQLIIRHGHLPNAPGSKVSETVGHSPSEFLYGYREE